jgi:hypothetical protein
MAFARGSAELLATRTTPSPFYRACDGSIGGRPSPAVHHARRAPRRGIPAGQPALCGSGQHDRALGRAFRDRSRLRASPQSRPLCNRGRYEEYATDSRECCVNKADLSLETPTLEAPKLSLAWRSYQTNALRYRWWGASADAGQHRSPRRARSAPKSPVRLAASLSR